ncbi:MAG: hypothetical protein M1155_00625 [Patescibacteria group bacterium]|nr:hypothetical protein [Patescibacteria group bacterium]
MNKKIIWPAILFIGFSIFGMIVLTKDMKIHSAAAKIGSEKNPIIFFYGQECPHCALVEQFIKENNVADKVSFEEKEVYHDPQNASELAEKANSCGIATNSIGVPFLWDGKNCIIGDQPVIDFFKQKIGQQ